MNRYTESERGMFVEKVNQLRNGGLFSEIEGLVSRFEVENMGQKAADGLFANVQLSEAVGLLLIAGVNRVNGGSRYLTEEEIVKIDDLANAIAKTTSFDKGEQVPTGDFGGIRSVIYDFKPRL